MESAPRDKRPRPRLESLADLIFGLSLSIGSIALIANTPLTAAAIDSHILAFIFVFVNLITVWMIYTTQMSVLPLETKLASFLNIVLLLLVALVPYLLNSVELTSSSLSAAQVSSLRDYSSSLFVLDLTGMLAILATFAHITGIEEKKLVSPEVARAFRSGRNTMIVLTFLMVITIAPQFWQITFLGTPLRLYFWYLPLAVYWVGRLVRPSSRISAGSTDARTQTALQLKPVRPATMHSPARGLGRASRSAFGERDPAVVEKLADRPQQLGIADAPQLAEIPKTTLQASDARRPLILKS